MRLISAGFGSMSDKEGEKDTDNESLSDWTLVNQEESNQNENDDEDLEEEAEGGAVGPPKEEEEDSDDEEEESEEEMEGAVAVAAPIAKSGSKLEEIKVLSGTESSDIETLGYSGLEDYPDHYQIVCNKGTFLTLRNLQFHNYKRDYAGDADAESLSSTDSPEEKVRKRRSRKPEATQDEETDLSLASSPSLPDDLPAIRPEPQYIHTPHQELNSRLNLIVALTLACVLGLGIGHFLGWSSRTLWEENLNAAQVRKLQELQENLLSCMSSPPLTSYSEHPSLQRDPYVDNEPSPISPILSPLNCDSTSNEDAPVFAQPHLRVPMIGHLNSKLFLNPLIDVLTEPLEDAGVIINGVSSSENIYNPLSMEDSRPAQHLRKGEDGLFNNEDITSYFRQEYDKEEIDPYFLKPQFKSSAEESNYIPVHNTFEYIDKMQLIDEKYLPNDDNDIIHNLITGYKDFQEIENPFEEYSDSIPLSNIPLDMYDDQYTQGYEIDYYVDNIDNNDLESNFLTNPKIIEKNNKNKHFEDMDDGPMKTNANEKFQSIKFKNFQSGRENNDFYEASLPTENSRNLIENQKIFNSINIISIDHIAGDDIINLNEYDLGTDELAESNGNKYCGHLSDNKFDVDSIDKSSYWVPEVTAQPKQLNNIVFISNELDNLNKKFNSVLQNLQKLAALQQTTSHDIGSIEDTMQVKANDYLYKVLLHEVNFQNESNEVNTEIGELAVQQSYMFSTGDKDSACNDKPHYSYSSTPIELTPSLTLILELPKIISNLEVENEALQAQILTLQASNLEPIKIKGKDGKEARELREKITQLISDNEDMRLAIARVQYNSLPDSDRGSFNRFVQENHHLRTSVAKLTHLGPDLKKLKSSITLLEQQNKELVASVAKIRYEQPMPRELKSIVKEMESIKQAVVTELQKKKPSSNLHSAKSYLVFMSQVMSAFNSFNDDEVGVIDKVDLARDVFTLVVPKGVKIPHLAQEKLTFGRSKFKEIKESLQTKWKQLKELTKPENIAEIGQSTLSKMNRVIVNVVNKIKDIAHMTILKQNKKPIDLVISVLADKINVLDEQFDKTWKSLQMEVHLPLEEMEEIFGPGFDDEPIDEQSEDNNEGDDDDDEDDNMLLAGTKISDIKENPNKSKMENEEKLRDLEIKKHMLMREEGEKKNEIKEKKQFEKEKEDFRKKSKKAVKEEISKNIKSVNNEEKKGKRTSDKKQELVEDSTRKHLDRKSKVEEVKGFAKPQEKGKEEKNAERPKFHVKEVQKANEPEPNGRYFKGQYNKFDKLKFKQEEEAADKKYFKRKDDEEEDEEEEDDETEQTHHKSHHSKHDRDGGGGGGLKRLWGKPENKKSSFTDTNGTKNLFIKRRG